MAVSWTRGGQDDATPENKFAHATIVIIANHVLSRRPIQQNAGRPYFIPNQVHDHDALESDDSKNGRIYMGRR
jgi:hypothetical protein